MDRKSKLYLGGSLVGFGVMYLIYSSYRKNKLFKIIKEAIGGAGGGSLSTYDEWFTPLYHKNFVDGNFILQSNGTALGYANTLYEEGFGMNDDEEKIYAVFRSIPDGVALSQVAEKYANKYTDLKEQIDYNLDKDEVRKISEILSQKPAYRKV
tara:strand:- start:383 stop:841 length:459 start_codon:yes stop_codon:yes gene_type:complete